MRHVSLAWLGGDDGLALDVDGDHSVLQDFAPLVLSPALMDAVLPHLVTVHSAATPTPAMVDAHIQCLDACALAPAASSRSNVLSAVFNWSLLRGCVAV